MNSKTNQIPDVMKKSGILKLLKSENFSQNTNKIIESLIEQNSVNELCNVNDFVSILNEFEQDIGKFNWNLLNGRSLAKMGIEKIRKKFREKFKIEAPIDHNGRILDISYLDDNKIKEIKIFLSTELYNNFDLNILGLKYNGEK